MSNYELDAELESTIFGLRREASAFFREKSYLKMQEPLIKAWELLPEPKSAYGESFLIARMMCESAIGLQNIAIAHQWLAIYKTADLSRIDSGERDFMEGRIAYLEGDFERAKSSFSIADKKSDGRLFQSPDYSEYYKFYKGR